MEVCCSPTSVLTSTIQSMTGQTSSASRCSHWNCGDLGYGKGLKLVLQRLEVENPSHVWLSPPCGPFSPLQNVNSRTPEQRAELEKKRAEAMRIYVSCCVIVHMCMQKGIHVTFEMSERCQAWRLPLLQNLQTKYSLFSTVTRGCRVGLRSGKDGQLLQKGWKIVTSCKRLAESWDLPCRCSRNYKHGRCEGGVAKDSELYTPEFARRVGNVVLQELDHHAVVAEAQGHSSLPSHFGEGARRMCHEVSLPKCKQTCGHCMLQSDVVIQGGSRVEGQGSGEQVRALEGIGSDEVDARVELEGQGSGSQVRALEGLGLGDQGVEGEVCQFSQAQTEQIERLARSMISKHQLDHVDCEQLLECLPLTPKHRTRGIVEGQAAVYVTFGAYSYGNHYGVTKITRRLPLFAAVFPTS